MKLSLRAPLVPYAKDIETEPSSLAFKTPSLASRLEKKFSEWK